MIKCSCKSLICIIAAFVCFILVPLSANASEPSSINLSYNSATKLLDVTVYHYSFDRTVDYIKTVEININSKPYASYSYTSQYDKTVAHFSYQIDAAQGDIIEVTAISTGTGQKTAAIKVN
jgi:hypothetical protein